MSEQGSVTCRLLVIDDEAIVGKRLKQVFSKMGFEVEIYTNPVSAMEAMARQPFDIVVTDLKMDEMDGMKVLSRVLEFNPKAKVIIITGYAQPENASEAFHKGAFDFIVKPFRLDELKKAIFNALGAMKKDK